jgi:hypothetical protein
MDSHGAVGSFMSDESERKNESECQLVVESPFKTVAKTNPRFLCEMTRAQQNVRTLQIVVSP